MIDVKCLPFGFAFAAAGTLNTGAVATISTSSTSLVRGNDGDVGGFNSFTFTAGIGVLRIGSFFRTVGLCMYRSCKNKVQNSIFQSNMKQISILM
jgi:hypothetical protein